MTPSPNTLARLLRSWFSDFLPRLRGMSPNTVHSYRDSFVLLLRFLGTHLSREVAVLDLDDIMPERVIAFLAWLESYRHNTVSTRNIRLSAIHAFFRFTAAQCPERLEQCQRILGVPFKRVATRAVEYLEYEEIQTVLEAINRETRDGRRDYALLALMFNTGARVQEVIDLRPCDLQLVRPFQIRLRGKGRKERLCPLWPQTAQLLSGHCQELGVEQTQTTALFLNHNRKPLTRFGVHYLLGKYVKLAAQQCPTLSGKRLHPHSMRHSAAVHLLNSGVDIVTISHWLGHASINTTNRYITIDLEKKRQALAHAAPVAQNAEDKVAWRNDASLLEWLEHL